VKVLVADDDRIAATVLAQTLRRWEFDVAMVPDGAEALRHLLAQDAATPTLAILDMYLMRLTSLESKGHIIAGLDSGADDYLVEPFDPDEIRARLNVGLRVLSLQERLADRVAELREALANVKVRQGMLPICGDCKRIRGDDGRSGGR